MKMYLRHILLICIENGRDTELIAIFEYLESVLIKQDDYASEVIALSVLKSIQYLLNERSKYKDMIGNETKKCLKNFKYLMNSML